MKKGLMRKVVYLGLALCVIASMLAFACAEPTPETPTTETPTTEKPTTEKPTIEKPTITPETQATPEAPTTTTTEEEPQYGGTLKVLSYGQMGYSNYGAPTIRMPFWNPTGPTAGVERLVKWYPGCTIEPMLAKSWEWSDDYTQLTLFLEEGVRFHDGTDFNAEAARYDIQLMLDSSQTWLKDVESVEVVDDYTIRLNVKQYSNNLLADLASTGGVMVSPTATETYGAEYCILNPVGTGPFKFVSYEEDVLLEWEKNDDYWREGMPYLDGIEVHFMADPVSSKVAFMAGEGHVLAEIDPFDAVDLQKSGNYKISSSMGGVAAYGGDGSNEDSIFSDIRIRRAISYAVDRQAIVDAVGYGFLEVANQASHPRLWSYNPDVEGYPYNPEKAIELLIEAGYPNGFKTKLTYGRGKSYVDQAYLIVQEQLSKVGIILELEAVTGLASYQLTMGGWHNQMITLANTISESYSPYTTLGRCFTSYGPYNVSLFHSEDIEAALAQAINEPDQDKVAALVQEVQRLISDEYCMATFLFNTVRMIAKVPEIHGTLFCEPCSDEWLPWTLWLEQ